MMKPLFFDIETISTTKPGYRERVAATIKPPAAMKKAETIAKWEAEEKEGAINEAVEKTVFNGGLCHVVQIQYAFGNDDIELLQAVTVEDEAKIISQFFNAIDSCDHISHFVGHYITGFDLRVLKQRAIVLGIALPNFFRKAVDGKPWDGYIFDTMTEWAGRDSVSMDNLCYYLDVESPKLAMDGSQFGDYWKSGKYGECREYGIAEIQSLRKVYAKMRTV